MTSAPKYQDVIQYSSGATRAGSETWSNFSRVQPLSSLLAAPLTAADLSLPTAYQGSKFLDEYNTVLAEIMQLGEVPPAWRSADLDKRLELAKEGYDYFYQRATRYRKYANLMPTAIAWKKMVDILTKMINESIAPPPPAPPAPNPFSTLEFKVPSQVLASPQLIGEYGRASILLDLLTSYDKINPSSEVTTLITSLNSLMKGTVSPQIVKSESSIEKDIATWLRDEDNKWREPIPGYITMAADKKNVELIAKLATNQARAATATIVRMSDLVIKAYPDQAGSLNNIKKIYTTGTDGLIKAVGS